MATKSIALWPGLPDLWFRGDWSSLGISVIFSVSLNLALLGTFVWPEWYPSWMIRLLWSGIILSSGFFFLQSYKRWSKITGSYQSDAKTNERLIVAQHHYLCGNYFEAEALIQKIVVDGNQDIEALLLLVSILRRTRRGQQALQWIDRISLCENAGNWRRELEIEKKLVREFLANPDNGKLDSIAA